MLRRILLLVFSHSHAKPQSASCVDVCVCVCVAAGKAPAQRQHARGKPTGLHRCLGNFQQLPQTSSGEIALLHTVHQEVRHTHKQTHS